MQEVKGLYVSVSSKASNSHAETRVEHRFKDPVLRLVKTKQTNKKTRGANRNLEMDKITSPALQTVVMRQVSLGLLPGKIRSFVSECE